MNALCIGESRLEITSVINTNLQDGLKLRLDEKIDNGAGAAGNIAYLLGKWGVDTYIASMFGADDNADKIKKEFESIGVKTDYIETSYDKQTGINLVLVNNNTKDNSVFKIGGNLHLKKYSFLVEPNLIIIDGTDLEASVAALDKYPNSKSFLVVNENNNDTQELCRYVNYIIFNEKSATEFTGITFDYNDSSTLVNAFNKLKQKFNKSEIIITIGKRGSIYSINGQVKIMPPVNVDVVDTNGAGQIFAGAFAYGVVRDFGIEKSICYATIAASLSINKLTSRGSIPSLTEVSSYYDGKFGTQNNLNTPSNPEQLTQVENVNSDRNDNTQNA